MTELSRLGHNKESANALLRRLEDILDGRILRFMEVCGTHTVAIFQSGLRSLLPRNICHLSGPGCPVCVTHEAEINLTLSLAGQDNILLATFGDFLRIPGANGESLKHARASGARIEIVYSPLDALRLARENPGKEVVFPGIGFETTAPAVAATLITARKEGIKNFSVLSMHKLVAPALHALLSENRANIQAFLLPGHVATITGIGPFSFIAQNFHKPAAICGFEPVDILAALCCVADLYVKNAPAVENAYQRAVEDKGNIKAQEILAKVFLPASAKWRGLGEIPASGLKISDEFADYDAMRKFQLIYPDISPTPGCQCGEILKGLKSPGDCALFGKKCTPAAPVGPCMVSTEGSCAAWYKYGGL